MPLLILPSLPPLQDDFIDQMCQGVEDCTECRATILESSTGNTKDAKFSFSLAEQSIFVYGREMHAVEQACEFVADFLQEYVNVSDKEKLAGELSKGWKKENYDETEMISDTLNSADIGSVETPPGLFRKAQCFSKKAKTVHASPEEEGQVHEPTELIQSDGSDSEGAKEQKTTCHSITTAGCVESQMPTAVPASESSDNILVDGPSLQPSGELELIRSSDEDKKPLTDTAAHMVNKHEPDNVQQGTMTRVITVPQFANEYFIKGK